MNDKKIQRLLLTCISITPIGSVKLQNGRHTGVRFAVIMADGRSGEYWGMKEESRDNFPIGVPRYYDVSTMDKYGVETLKFSPVRSDELTPEEKAKAKAVTHDGTGASKPAAQDQPDPGVQQLAGSPPTKPASLLALGDHDTILEAASVIAASILVAAERIPYDELALTAMEVKKNVTEMMERGRRRL